MEIEKTLFKIHEKFLFNNTSKKVTLCGMIVCFVLGKN